MRRERKKVDKRTQVRRAAATRATTALSRRSTTTASRALLALRGSTRRHDTVRRRCLARRRRRRARRCVAASSAQTATQTRSGRRAAHDMSTRYPDASAIDWHSNATVSMTTVAVGNAIVTHARQQLLLHARGVHELIADYKKKHTTKRLKSFAPVVPIRQVDLFEITNRKH